MSRRLHRVLLIIGIVGVAFGVAVVLGNMKPPPEKKDIEQLDMLVEVLELQPSSEQFSIRSQGTVRPRTQTAVSAEVSGSIVSMSRKFVAGGLFAAGEELLRIDPTSYEVAVTQAEALVKQRQIEYDGALSLRSKGYRAEAELASAEAALATAKAALVNAQQDLRKTRISLPFAGMVRSKAADLGQFVNRGSQLGVVFATDYAEVRLPLTDAELAFVDLPLVSGNEMQDGPAVELSAEQRGRQQSWPARITRSEGVVDEESRVTYVVARIDDPYRLASSDGRPPLPMGTFVNATIAGREIADLIRVPRSALRNGTQLLFIDAGNRVQVRAVDVLRADANYAWIESGAAAGQRISLTPIESPINGMKVRTEAATGAIAGNRN